MSKYDPLARFLDGRREAVWEASFSDVERVLGESLPHSARKHRPWWANQSGAGHSQTSGWQSVGWETRDVDLERERVRFVRRRPAGDSGPHIRSNSPVSDGGGDARAALLARARHLTGMGDDEIIDKALRAFILRKAALDLISMGGSMPCFDVPKRERPQP